MPEPASSVVLSIHSPSPPEHGRLDGQALPNPDGCLVPSHVLCCSHAAVHGVQSPAQSTSGGGAGGSVGQLFSTGTAVVLISTNNHLLTTLSPSSVNGCAREDRSGRSPALVHESWYSIPVVPLMLSNSEDEVAWSPICGADRTIGLLQVRSLYHANVKPERLAHTRNARERVFDIDLVHKR